jgi:hypothetical protein
VTREYSVFLEATPTRAQVVETARRYIGVKYSARHASVIFLEASGRFVGQCDCLRLLLLIARDLGYLPSSFDVNLPRPKPKLSRDEAMWELLRANLDEVPRAMLLPGDVLLFAYHDLNPDISGAHHVGILSSSQPAPYGSLIDCEDFEANGAGGVAERRFDALQWRRLESVWRLRGIREENA